MTGAAKPAGVLEAILAHKREEIAALRARGPAPDQGLTPRYFPLHSRQTAHRSGTAPSSALPNPQNPHSLSLGRQTVYRLSSSNQQLERREEKQHQAEDQGNRALAPHGSGFPGPSGGKPIAALGRAPLQLICEIKRRSPSTGALDTTLGVAERAARYASAGADLLSVLTDARSFGGSFDHLTEARRACELPILCKEFILDPVQLEHAASAGADAVLLIVRCLGPALRSLHQAATALKLTPLVEVTTEAEAAQALAAGARWIGVNARDLDTLEIDLPRAERVLAALPPDIVTAQLSGLSTPEAVARVAQSRADAALIGTALMREADPAPLLRVLRAAAG
ncbi:MAG: indole-3-glycerol-phosphate synthase [Polyangiaceae bacterium]|nr:indole-3-glycerol-phosphate synthase [Polyangiaceae bacterium]MCW5790984.1 indole-3-glycerol-phosphate synthase [Polyangiaceae bacterium]